MHYLTLSRLIIHTCLKNTSSISEIVTGKYEIHRRNILVHPNLELLWTGQDIAPEELSQECYEGPDSGPRIWWDAVPLS